MIRSKASEELVNLKVEEMRYSEYGSPDIISKRLEEKKKQIK